MGTDNIYDDVIITSDSSDYWDHYQDGYNTYSATHLYRTHFGGRFNNCYSYLIIKRPETLSVWAIVGMVAGGVLLLGGATFLTIFLIKKKKKQK